MAFISYSKCSSELDNARQAKGPGKWIICINQSRHWALDFVYGRVFFMTMRIVKHPLSTPQRKGKPRKEKDYLDFLHRLPCVVTGSRPVEAAHVSFAAPQYGHYGRGKGTKTPDRWAVSLSPGEHVRQHKINERQYWEARRIDPHFLALVIYGLWNELGDDAEPYCEAVIMEGLRK